MIEGLNFEDVWSEDIDDDALLFGEGLGLDSLDAVEIMVSSVRYASYKVRPGDTWWGVAKKHKVSVEALQATNKKGAAGKLQIGQALKIPGVAALAKAEKADAGEWAAKRANYVVREGDTLWGIAKQFKMDAATLSKANNLSSKALKVGQKIYVPDMGGARTMAAKAKAATMRVRVYSSRGGTALVSREIGRASCRERV